MVLYSQNMRGHDDRTGGVPPPPPEGKLRGPVVSRVEVGWRLYKSWVEDGLKGWMESGWRLGRSWMESGWRLGVGMVRSQVGCKLGGSRLEAE